MNNHPDRCFTCTDGKYRQVIEDYPVTGPDGVRHTVKDLLVLRCAKCGDELITPESSRRIDAAVFGGVTTEPPTHTNHGKDNPTA